MKVGGQPQTPAALSLGYSPRNTVPIECIDVLEKGKICCSYRHPNHESSSTQPGPLVPLGVSVNLASNYHVPGDRNLDNKEYDSLKSHTPVRLGP